jgi:hypothetical protein
LSVADDRKILNLNNQVIKMEKSVKELKIKKLQINRQKNCLYISFYSSYQKLAVYLCREGTNFPIFIYNNENANFFRHKQIESILIYDTKYLTIEDSQIYLRHFLRISFSDQTFYDFVIHNFQDYNSMTFEECSFNTKLLTIDNFIMEHLYNITLQYLIHTGNGDVTI